MNETIKIKMNSEHYKKGICSFNNIVGIERQIKFDNEEVIEVTADEYETLKKINENWFVIIQEGENEPV